MALYDERYSDWKGWSEAFGVLSEAGRIYFDSELVNAGLIDQSGLKVIEFGFGGGEFLSYCRSKGWGVRGVEVSRILLDVAVAAGFDCLDFSDVASVEDGAADLIVAFDVLEHLSHAEIEGFISESIRLLKPGGVMLFRFPNGDSPFSMIFQNGDFTHVSAIGRGKVDYLCSKFSLELIYFGGQALVVRSKLKRYVWGWLRSIFNRFLNVLVYGAVVSDIVSANSVVVLKKKFTGLDL